MKIRAIAAHFIETAPLLAFLIYAEHIEPLERSVPLAWLGPYLLGSGLAVLAMLCLWRWGQPLNRLIVGINAYFVSGALSLLLHWRGLNELYGQLQAAGMLLAMLVSGAFMALLCPGGLLGVRQVSRRAMHGASLFLWCTCLAAFVFSWQHQGNRWLAEFVPFVSVFVLQRLLQAWLSRQASAAL